MYIINHVFSSSLLQLTVLSINPLNISHYPPIVTHKPLSHSLSCSLDMSASGIKRCNTNTRPVQRDSSVKQKAIKGPYGKSPGCKTSCGLRLPRKTEGTATKLIKHLGCKFAKGLRLVVMRKEKRCPPSKVCSFTGRSQPSIIPINNDNHRSEAIEDCIEFINSSSSFTRSNSTS